MMQQNAVDEAILLIEKTSWQDSRRKVRHNRRKFQQTIYSFHLKSTQQSMMLIENKEPEERSTPDIPSAPNDELA